MARFDRVTIIIFISCVTTFLTVTNAYLQRKQFYPTAVYLTKSSGPVAVLYFQGAVLTYLFFSFIRWIFFGQLRVAEVEHALDRLWHAIVETCLAFTVFRDDFSPQFVIQFVVLFFFKGFHWLAEDRVDYMERSPTITILFHARIMGILSLLAAVNSYFISNAFFITLQKGASVQIVFGFEYAILLTMILHIAMKYILHINDLRSVHPWESKAVYMLYSELVVTFLRSILYFIFAAVMVRIHTFPLFAIRPFYLTVRSLRKAVNDVIQSRRAINAMNNLYPLATEQELRDGDNTCIICREEMTVESGAKKLPCNHIFHPNCLRSWFQRQQTCPTCRTDVLGATRERFPNAPQANGQNIGEGLAAMLAGLGFPQFQPQQAAAAQPQPAAQQFFAQNGAQGIRIQFGVAGGPNGQQILIPPMMAGGPMIGGGVPGVAADGAAGANAPIIFPTPIPFPQPPTNAGLSDIELAQMEGATRAAIEARLQSLRNIQTLLEAAALQFQQYLAVAPPIPPMGTMPPTDGPSANNAEPSTSSAAPPSGPPNTESGPSAPAPVEPNRAAAEVANAQ